MTDRSKLEQLEQWISWPEWAQDAVVSEAEVTLSWREILLLIWRRGRLGITAKTWTANRAGRTQGFTRVEVRGIKWPWTQPNLGVADSEIRP